MVAHDAADIASFSLACRGSVALRTICVISSRYVASRLFRYYQIHPGKVLTALLHPYLSLRPRLLGLDTLGTRRALDRLHDPWIRELLKQSASLDLVVNMRVGTRAQ
jgi:hypothetical protein